VAKKESCKHEESKWWQHHVSIPEAFIVLIMSCSGSHRFMDSVLKCHDCDKLRVCECVFCLFLLCLNVCVQSNCGSASGLPYYCTSTCARSGCTLRASCVDSKPKKKKSVCVNPIFILQAVLIAPFFVCWFGSSQGIYYTCLIQKRFPTFERKSFLE